MIFLFAFAGLVVLAALFGRRGIRWKRVAQLEVGMSAREVIKKVGRPYSITTSGNGDERWLFIEVAAKSNGSFSILMRNGEALQVPNFAARQLGESIDDESKEHVSRQLRWMGIIVVASLIIFAFAVVGKKYEAPDQSTAGAPSSARPARSVALDCSKLNAETLKIICMTPDLAKADSRLEKAYRDALAHTASAVALRRDERAWINLRNKGPADAKRLRALYKERIAELKLYLRRTEAIAKTKDAVIGRQSSSDAPSETVPSDRPIEVIEAHGDKAPQ